MTQIQSITKNIEYTKELLQRAKSVIPTDEMQKMFKQSNIKHYNKEIKSLELCLSYAVKTETENFKHAIRCNELNTKFYKAELNNKALFLTPKYRASAEDKIKSNEENLVHLKKSLNDLTK